MGKQHQAKKSEIIQAQADMISSVNKTISGAAKSTNETIAKNIAALVNR